MVFNIIDKEKWDRKPYFENYLNTVKCTYSITANIEITGLLSSLKQKDIKFYPTIIYIISSAVNNHREFRTTFDKNGNLGYWDILSPSYTIFHKESETFSCIWTKFDKDFSHFYNSWLDDLKNYGNINEFAPKANEPENTFPVSCIPWVSFTGFNLNIYNDATYLLPIFTVGKYFRQDKKVLLPISVQAHHAVCDGFHVSRLINEMQESALNYEKWLKK